MSTYVPVGWDAITLLSGKNLNLTTTQYACAKSFTDVHNHDSAYYTETQIAAKCFSDAGIQPDADMIDGKHWDEIIIDFLPVGFICFWEGSRATIPTGWHECDGSTVDGLDLPDVRDHIPLGAGAVHAALSTGGSATITNCIVTSALGSYVLTIDELPIHYHKWMDTYNSTTTTANMNGSSNTVYGDDEGSIDYDSNYNNAGADTGHTHGNKSATFDEFNIMPPYIVKIAICKVQ